MEAERLGKVEEEERWKVVKGRRKVKKEKVKK